MDKVILKSIKQSTAPLHLTLLKGEVDRRIRLNPQYSLRSFAKQVGLDASLLSKVLKNQRKLTPENGRKILQKSQMNPSDKKLFWSSLIQEREKLNGVYDEVSDEILYKDHSFEEKLLPNETFQLIAEPHHYVLAELVRTKDFISDIAWISKRLNLSKAETSQALNRLIRVGILAKDGEKFVRPKGRVSTENKAATDSALQFHQRRILEKAVTAMDLVPLEQRAQNSMTIAINPKKIPLAKELIQQFINQLSNLLEAGPLEEVYQLSVSLFPNHQSERVP